MTSTERIGTIAHELGHAFGLTHNNRVNNGGDPAETDHIMCTYGDGRTTTYVHEEEYEEVLRINGEL